MTERIEYLYDLGVTCLWLMPFYPTARKDDGYDITDFFGVDPKLGTLGDFVELVRTARSKGIRVIVDFVMNHTSDRHPWFKSARRSKDDPYRDYYVWSSSKPESSAKDVVFPDQEASLWERDPKTNEYYLHHFYKHQPDLNIGILKCRRRSHARSVMARVGFSGFRVDAVPFLFAKDAVPGKPGCVRPDRISRRRPQFRHPPGRRRRPARRGERSVQGPARILRRPRRRRAQHAVRLHRNAEHLSVDGPRRCPADRQSPQTATALDITSQWANFLRNHDELTLDKLSDDERQEVFDAFGSDKDMQLYGRGLPARLPSMLGGDEQRMRMAYSLAFSLPGTPVLFYGEEIGMAENLDIPGRLAVRTPMQWTTATNGGFSTASKRRLCRPLPDGLYGPDRVNAAGQRRDHQSFWWFMRNLIYTYRSQPEIGWSTVEVLKQANSRSWRTCAARSPVGPWSRCTTSARTAPWCRFTWPSRRRVPNSSTCSTAFRSTRTMARAVSR